MALIKYELIVEEDLNLGSGAVEVSMPAGGSTIGHRINMSTFRDSVGVAVADLPDVALYKGAYATVNDATAITPGSIVAGGGANFVAVWSNGVNWKIVTG